MTNKTDTGKEDVKVTNDKIIIDWDEGYGERVGRSGKLTVDRYTGTSEGFNLDWIQDYEEKGVRTRVFKSIKGQCEKITTKKF